MNLAEVLIAAVLAGSVGGALGAWLLGVAREWFDFMGESCVVCEGPAVHVCSGCIRRQFARQVTEQNRRET